MRLFFAIQLPAEIRDELGRLKPGDENRDYRWVDASLIHVTIAFLGEVPAERIAVLEEVGAAAARDSCVGTLRLGGAGEFGSKRAPRVLLASLSGDVDAVTSLQSRLDAGLRQASFQLEERHFRPHITLARRRETASGGPPLGWPPRLRPSTFEMDKLTLFQSRLGPRGPTYVALAEFRIGG